MAKKKTQLILIAEDDKAYGHILTTKLTRAGYEVTIVGDGQAALVAARAKKPGLILLDLMMPIKDGFATLEEIKKDPKLRSIDVIILTNLSQPEDAERCRRLGARECYIKSNTSLHDIVAHIEEVFL